MEKKPLKTLFRHNSETPEGKYLVKRRDGTVVEWPSFVLGARDENAQDALRFYALLCMLPEAEREELMMQILAAISRAMLADGVDNKEFALSCMREADVWEQYRQEHGDGDPLMGKHRVDDPATIAEMRQGHSA